MPSVHIFTVPLQQKILGSTNLSKPPGEVTLTSDAARKQSRATQCSNQSALCLQTRSHTYPTKIKLIFTSQCTDPGY